MNMCFFNSEIKAFILILFVYITGLTNLKQLNLFTKTSVVRALGVFDVHYSGEINLFIH